MQLFLDGSDIEKIRKFSKLGLIDGITTNPSIILKSGKNMLEVISELAEMVSGSDGTSNKTILISVPLIIVSFPVLEQPMLTMDNDII